MPSGRRITVPSGCTLIFWGNNFDEATTIIFATMLRDAGICVKMVGINGPCATGQNGITLQSDILISELSELIEQVRCIVFPCGQSSCQRMENDPRLTRLFAEAARSGAMFIVNTSRDLVQALLPSSTSQEQILIYPGKEDLSAFVATIVYKLSGRFPSSIKAEEATYQIASPSFS